MHTEVLRASGRAAEAATAAGRAVALDEQKGNVRQQVLQIDGDSTRFAVVTGDQRFAAVARRREVTITGPGSGAGLNLRSVPAASRWPSRRPEGARVRLKE